MDLSALAVAAGQLGARGRGTFGSDTRPPVPASWHLGTRRPRTGSPAGGRPAFISRRPGELSSSHLLKLSYN